MGMQNRYELAIFTDFEHPGTWHRVLCIKPRDQHPVLLLVQPLLVYVY